MLVRLISGAILLLLMGSGMVIGDWWLFLLCLSISLMGLFEFYRTANIHKSIVGLVGYAGTLGLYGVIGLVGDELVVLVLAVMTIVWMAAMVFAYPRINVSDIAFALLGVVYVALMLSYIFQTRQLNDGEYFVWLIFISAWGSDSFAYLTGITLGRHRLAPVLSPKKSVEGAVGGVVGAAVLGGLYGWIVLWLSGGNLIVEFVIASALGAVVSIVGDLAASAVKRFCNVKDYGRVIPGHGGVMDRFDSVIFTAPIVYWALYFLIR
jgi:phosphatidate cytidylyltransferase